GRAELPAPERLAPNGLAEPAGAPPPGDLTPIFEAARSDWFVTEPSDPAPLPYQQRRQRGPGSDGHGRPASRPAPQPPPMPPPPSTPAPEETRKRALTPRP